jgi:hypothetical protein
MRKLERSPYSISSSPRTLPTRLEEPGTHREFCLAGRVSITRRGTFAISVALLPLTCVDTVNLGCFPLPSLLRRHIFDSSFILSSPMLLLSSFLDMVEDSATRFPPSFYAPPTTLTSVPTASLPSIAPRPPLPQSQTQPVPAASLVSSLLPSFATNPSQQPTTAAASSTTSPPRPASQSAINLRLGGYELSTEGIYRSSPDASGSTASLQIDGGRVKEGLTTGLAGARDLGTSLFGRVRQGVEARRLAGGGGTPGV